MNAYFLLLALPLSATASSVIFSNLQGNALLCGCSTNVGASIGTIGIDPTEHFTMADAFETPTSSRFMFESLSVSIGSIRGQNGLAVSLYSDRSGLPGMPLETFSLESKAVFGRDAPPLEASSMTHPILAAGTRYWVVVGSKDTFSNAGWYLNNAEDIGLVATRIDRDGIAGADEFCCLRTTLQSAFAVHGTPLDSIPEPRTVGTVGLGCVLLAISRFASASRNGRQWRDLRRSPAETTAKGH